MPLVVRAPALGAARYAGVTRSIDVLPTLLGLAGVPVPSGAGGVDLSAALRRRAAPPELRAFSHTALQQVASPGPVPPSVLRGPSRTDPQGMWIAAREGLLTFKLVQSAGRFRPRAYDWERDPAETRDLFDAARPEHRAMVRAMARYKRRLLQGYARAKAGDAVPDRRREDLLRALGYIQ